MPYTAHGGLRVVLHGRAHCCACDQPCWHVGPIRLCHAHTPQPMRQTITHPTDRRMEPRMTWNAYATVTNADGTDPVRVTAVADPVEQPTSRPWGDAGAEVPTITSNTEGAISYVKVEMLFNEDASPVRVGDVIYVGGHFARPDPAATP